MVRLRPKAEDEPNLRSRRYIAVFSPTRPHIYDIYPFLPAVLRAKSYIFLEINLGRPTISRIYMIWPGASG